MGLFSSTKPVVFLLYEVLTISIAVSLSLLGALGLLRPSYMCCSIVSVDFGNCVTLQLFGFLLGVTLYKLEYFFATGCEIFPEPLLL